MPTAPQPTRPNDPTFAVTVDRGTFLPLRKTKAALLKSYRTQLDASKKWRKEEKYDEIWRRLIDLYRGKHFSEADVNREDKIAINVAFSTKNVIAPSVSVNYPKVTVTARQPQWEAAEQTVEAAANYWWKRYRFHPEVRRAVDDYIMVGHGWVKVGYRYEETEQVRSADDMQAEFQQLQDQTNQAAEQDPGQATQLPTDQQLMAGVSDTKMVPSIDQPFVERVSTFDMYVDPEATSLQDAKWIAQRIIMSLEEAKAEESYSPAARGRLEADAAMNPRWRDKGAEGQSREGKYDDGIKRVTIWEFYDLRHGKMCVFADKGETFLVDPTDLPYPYGMPYRMLRNYDVPDQFYPLGDLEMIEPIQRELNETRSAMMNHRKRYQRKYVANRQALDEEAIAALESDVDNAIVYVDDNTPLGEVVAPLPISSIDPQMYNYSQTILSDMDLVSGVSEYQRGALSETRRTATEAAMIQDAVNARSQDKLATIEVFLAEIAQCVVALAQTYLTGEQILRVVGEQGAASWVSFTREDIQGEYDFDVEAGSTQPLNDTQRRQTALQLANVLAPYVGMAVNPQELVLYVLKDGFGIKEAERFLTAMPPVDPTTGMPMNPPMGMQQGQPQASPSNALPMPGPNMDPRMLLEAQQNPQAGAALNQLAGQIGLSLPNSGGQ